MSIPLSKSTSFSFEVHCGWAYNACLQTGTPPLPNHCFLESTWDPGHGQKLLGVLGGILKTGLNDVVSYHFGFKHHPPKKITFWAQKALKPPRRELYGFLIQCDNSRAKATSKPSDKCVTPYRASSASTSPSGGKAGPFEAHTPSLKTNTHTQTHTHTHTQTRATQCNLSFPRLGPCSPTRKPRIASSVFDSPITRREGYAVGPSVFHMKWLFLQTCKQVTSWQTNWLHQPVPQQLQTC